MLSHQRRVAAPVDGFVGFAIGRSIREDATAAHRRGELDDASTGTVILQENCATPTSTAPATPSCSSGISSTPTRRRHPVRRGQPIGVAPSPSSELRSATRVAGSTEPTGRILPRGHAESAPAVIYAITDGYNAGGSCHAAPHGDVPTLFAASRTRLVSR